MEYLLKCYFYVTTRDILKTSKYPGMWKLANVTPIFKNSNTQQIKNYRPISLLPIFNNLYNYLNVNNLIIKDQSDILQ